MNEGATTDSGIPLKKPRTSGEAFRRKYLNGRPKRQGLLDGSLPVAKPSGPLSDQDLARFKAQLAEVNGLIESTAHQVVTTVEAVTVRNSALCAKRSDLMKLIADDFALRLAVGGENRLPLNANGTPI